MRSIYAIVYFCVMTLALETHEGHARTISTAVKIQQVAIVDTKQNIAAVAEDPAVTKLREYLRIKTVQPTPDYESAIKWFQKYADYIGLKCNLVRFQAPDLFAIWFTWNGTDPTLESILFNSHMDVVSADPEKWKYDPFAAYKDENGNIYARGAADMKSKTIAQLEAIRRLKQQGFQPLRTVYVSVIPDEEISGEHGMKKFVNSPEFRALNVGLDMDEGGGPGAEGTAPDGRPFWGLTTGSKSPWQFNITATGVAGHGAGLGATETAGEKIYKVIDRLMALKFSEIAKMKQFGLTDSDITTINLVGLGGGTANNILPHELWATFDMRIRIRSEPGSWSFSDYETFLNKICADAGSGVTYSFTQRGMISAETVSDESNMWWRAVENVCSQMNRVCKPIFSGPTTDARFVRNIGISAFGYSPAAGSAQTKTDAGLGAAHQDNEGINEMDFLALIEDDMKIIQSLSMFLP